MNRNHRRDRMKLGPDTEALMIRVEGIVQRVGFRRYVERMAWRFKLSGYVENLKDGSVRIFVQGSKKSQLDEFASELKKAPEPIMIAKLDSRRTRTVPSLSTFQIKSAGGPMAAEFQEAFGGMETQFGEYRQEFRSFAKRTDDSFELDTKYGEISEKLIHILETLAKESTETRRELTRAVDSLVAVVDKTLSEKQ
jgi:acylphosphatase